MPSNDQPDSLARRVQAGLDATANLARAGIRSSEDLATRQAELRDMYAADATVALVHQQVNRSISQFIGQVASPANLAAVHASVVDITRRLGESHRVSIPSRSVRVSAEQDGTLIIHFDLTTPAGRSMPVRVIHGEMLPPVVTPGVTSTQGTNVSWLNFPADIHPTGPGMMRPRHMTIPNFLSPTGDSLCHMVFTDTSNTQYRVVFKTNRFKVFTHTAQGLDSEQVYDRGAWDVLRMSFLNAGVAMPSEYPETGTPAVSVSAAQVELQAKEMANKFMWEDDVPPLEAPKLKRTFNFD